MTHPATACPDCPALPGKSCTTPNGSHRKPHRSRLLAAGLPVPRRGQPRKRGTLTVSPELADRIEGMARDAGLSVDEFLQTPSLDLG